MSAITALKVLGFVFGVTLPLAAMELTGEVVAAFPAMLPGAFLYAIALQREPLDGPPYKWW